MKEDILYRRATSLFFNIFNYPVKHTLITTTCFETPTSLFYEFEDGMENVCDQCFDGLDGVFLLRTSGDCSLDSVIN